MEMTFLWAKFCIYVAKWWEIFWSYVTQPISIFSLIFLFATFWFYFKDGGLPRVIEEALNFLPAVKPFICAILIWITVIFIFVCFRLQPEINEDGKFTNNGFVYHDPKILDTITVTTQDNEKSLPVKVKYAPANSTVSLRMMYDGGLAQVLPFTGMPYRSYGRKASDDMWVKTGDDKTVNMLKITIPPNSDDTTVRIYMKAWKIEKAAKTQH